MIVEKEFVKAVKEYFIFLEVEHDMHLSNEVINGSFYYDISYRNKVHTISISYENAEDYYQVIIFKLHNDITPSYDDKMRTLHLNRLNSLILPTINKSELDLNNEYFLRYDTVDGLKKRLLKSAKELRLCLRYLNECMLR